MTIAEIVQAVLKDNGKPMHVNEIYDEVIRRQLYSFGAKDPKSVLSNSIRTKSSANPKAKTILFKAVSQGVYQLTE